MVLLNLHITKGSLVLPNYYQTSSLPVLVGSLNCTGQESLISECSQSNCPTSSDASVVCQGEIVYYRHVNFFLNGVHAYCMAMYILQN